MRKSRSTALDILKLIARISFMIHFSLKHLRWHLFFSRVFILLGIFVFFCSLLHSPGLSTVSTTGDQPGRTAVSHDISGLTAAFSIPTALGTASVIQSLRFRQNANPDENNFISSENDGLFPTPHSTRSLNSPNTPFHQSDRQKFLRLDIPPPSNLIG